MEEQALAHFQNEIQKTAEDEKFPLRAMFELTYRCNFKCIHCYVPCSWRKKYKNELNTKQVCRILDQLSQMGCFYLGFTGGEPFLRRDIFDLLWYAKKKGLQVILYTNGSLIDKTKVDKLLSLNLNKIDITLLAMSEAPFERISGVVGSHRKVFKAIELLSQRRIPFGFKAPILQENANEIEKIKAFAKHLGVSLRLDDMLFPRLNGSIKPYLHQVQPRHAEAFLWAGKRKKKREGCMETLSNNGLFKCQVGKTQVAITPDGKLKMCLMIDYPKYNILNSTLSREWKRLQELVNRVAIDMDYQCRICKLRLYCRWCPARGWLKARSFTHCDTFSRQRAQFIKQLVETR